MVCIIALILATYFIYTRVINKDAKFEIISNDLEQNLPENKEIVLMEKVIMVSQKLEKDETITQQKIILIEVAKAVCPSNALFATGDVVGKKASIPIGPNTIITDSMFYSPTEGIKESDKLKDYELSGGMVGGMVSEGAYIDLEFINPKGETFIVLAKKLVKKKLDNNRIILQLSFDERKLINYAFAEQKELGGRLDAVVYVDNRQPIPKVDYPIPKLANKLAQNSATTNDNAPNNNTSNPNAPIANPTLNNPDAPISNDKPVRGGIN